MLLKNFASTGVARWEIYTETEQHTDMKYVFIENVAKTFIYEKANKQADELRACRRMRRWLTGCQVEGRGGWTPFEAKEIRSMQLSLLTFYYICNWQHHSHLHEYETICKHWETELQIACLRYLESNSIRIYLISNLNWRKIEDYKVGKVKQCWY